MKLESGLYWLTCLAAFAATMLFCIAMNLKAIYDLLEGALP